MKTDAEIYIESIGTRPSSMLLSATQSRVTRVIFTMAVRSPVLVLQFLTVGFHGGYPLGKQG